MQLNIIFDKIKAKAKADEDFRKRIIAASNDKHAIVEFCKVCREAGIEIYPMDIADADESVYAAMRRSTNGGGENSPRLNWQDDMFTRQVEEML